MRMRAANQNAIVIVGALVMRLTATTESGQAMTTPQIMYFTHSADKFFLSLEACKDLGIVPKTFPHVESDMIDASPPHSDDTESVPEENCCNCPPRQNPPPIPTALPFPATEENGEIRAMAFGLLQGTHFQHMSTPKTANDFRPTHEAYNRR